MKRIFAILTIAAIGFSFAPKANAIEDQWGKGTMVVGAMAGYYPGIGGVLTGDYVLVDSWWKGHFTVGAQVNYRYWKFSESGRYNDLAAAPRATYGLNITDKFEVHAGVMIGLGYRAHTVYTGLGTEEKHKETKLGLCYGGLAGVRFFFTENFGVQAEFNYSGYGPYANAGIAFKF